MNSFYFHVISGPQAGSFLELIEGTEYSVSNNYDVSDIYLESNVEFYFELVIEDRKLKFEAVSENIIIGTDIIKSDFYYELPLALSANDILLIISDEATLSNERVKQYLTEHNTLLNNKISVSSGGYVEDSNNEITGVDCEAVNDFSSSLNRANKYRRYMNKVKFVSSTYYKYFKSKLVHYWASFRARFGMWSYLIVGSILSMVLVVIIVLQQFRSQSMADDMALDSISTSQAIQSVIVKLPGKYANLKLSKINDKFLISGVVNQESDLTGLGSYFKPWNKVIKFQILSFSNIKNQIIQILMANQIMVPNVTFHNNLGTIAIWGISNSNKNLDDVAIAISNQYPMLGDIDNSKVYLTSDLDKEVNNLVANNGNLQINITNDLINGNISLTGYVTEDTKRSIESGVKLFNQKFNGVVKITVKLQDVLDAIPFKISAVYNGSQPWIETDNGVRVYIGGTYQGVSLIAIDDDKITLRKNVTFTISLDQLLASDVGGVGKSVTTDCCSRESIIKAEKSKEQGIIKQEEQQLHDLQIILPTIKDQKSKQSFINTINNLNQDLEYRKRATIYYKDIK